MAEKEELKQELKEIKEMARRRWSKKKYGAWKTKDKFVDWFVEKYASQGGKCYYCGLDGNVLSNYKQQLKDIGMYITEKMKCGDKKGSGFRKGTRGKSLKVEKKEPKQPYNKRNCILACYPCNNAKSDVFSRKEFRIIGAVIGRLMNKENKEKLIKMKNNKFFQGLVNDVEKQKKLRKSKLIMILKKLQEK